MKEQLISFETVRLAKETGFNFKGEQPTQSLLQKWLRDIHGLYVLPEATFTFALITKIGFYAKVVKMVNDADGPELQVVFFDNMFDSTYEKALEAGMVAALKMMLNNVKFVK